MTEQNSLTTRKQVRGSDHFDQATGGNVMKNTIRLTESDAAIVKGMLRRGDKQHDIAALFGVNGGRIAEVATGYRFEEIPEADQDTLPPAGAYPVVGFLHLLNQALRYKGEDAVRAALVSLLES